MAVSLPRSVRSFTLPHIAHYGSLHSSFSCISNSPMNNDMISVAPMMEYTDRNYRYLIRLISKRCKLYTEMVASNTLVYNDEVDRWLRFNPDEEPLVLQLGGSDVKSMMKATNRAMEYGYKEINLNCGCPSERVADSGAFGAALMLKPQLVSDLCQSIQDASYKTSSLNGVLIPPPPPSVKCRIGVIDKKEMKYKLDGDDDEAYHDLAKFIDHVSHKGGVQHFIIHARKAVLGGLSTSQNRQIPPLKYELVHRLNTDFPNLHFTINGGIETIHDGEEHLRRGLRGIMLGRSVVAAPWKVLSGADHVLFGDPPSDLTRRKVLSQYGEYGENEMKNIELVNPKRALNLRRALMRPLAYLFAGETHGARYRAMIETLLKDSSLSVSEIIQSASSVIADETLDAIPLLRSLDDDGV